MSHRERLQDVVQDFDDVVLLRDQERRVNLRCVYLSFQGSVVVLWLGRRSSHVVSSDIVLVSVLILGGDLLLFLGPLGDIFRGPVDLHHEQDMFRGLVVIVKVYPIGHWLLKG